MTEKEELMFGIFRWINKVSLYCNNKSEEEFLNDDMCFDACCYCLETISEIASKLITKYPEVIKENPKVNFEALSKIYSNCIKEDNINVSYVYSLSSYELKGILPYLNINFRGQ